MFRSWDEGQLPYVQLHENRLTLLLENNNAQFEMFSIPEASKNEFVKLRTTPKRPYRLNSLPEVELEDSGIVCPIELREYQERAILRWKENSCCGLFEMATGTGKTITALAAAANVYNERNKLALVIFVPYLHLVDQWVDEVRKFGFSPICCSGENQKWKHELFDIIDNFRLGIQDNICIIATHATAATDDFAKHIARCPSESLLLLADEAHSLGAATLRKSLFPNAAMRLGLSATPERWYDPEGTQVLQDYFRGVVFEFPLEEAIGKFLTPYYYHPTVLHLEPFELNEYKELTAKIVRSLRGSQDDPKKKDSLSFLYRKRALIIQKAAGKMQCLVKIIENLREKSAIKHLLVYCAQQETDQVIDILANQMNLRCHRFVSDVPTPERKKILRNFGNGCLDALVAIKCLDEGVDVPATRTAIFMASTTNPREFVQRRGRVLRKYDSKQYALIYDMLVLPDQNEQNTDIDTAKSLIRREMPRFVEFASAAENKQTAQKAVVSTLDFYGMEHYSNLLPWDIYKNMIQDGELIPFE